MSGFNLYETVTETVIEALERGVVPWRKPWKTHGDGLQKNLNSGRPYRGINQFLLGLSAFDSPYWVTFKGMKKLGGTLTKVEGHEGKGTGQKSTLVVFWKRIVTKETDPETGETGTRVVPLLRYFRVFNTDQIEWTGDVPKKVAKLNEPNDGDLDFNPIEAADKIIAGMPNPPKRLANGGDRAYYSPMEDNYRLPKREHFDSEEDCYSAEFHELAHSTGHKSRLNRPEIAKATMIFGDNDYSNEELVAEMSAAMLCAVAGIHDKTIENSSSYIQSWLKRLKEKDNKKLVVIAAARAQKAADHIQNIKWEDPTEDE